MDPGVLYLVATPIGNLEDITLRALRILGEVDGVVAEDTRRTRVLLTKHAIHKPLISYHAHNERRRLPQLLDRLRQGDRLALVTDAGTPGISDPGYLLAREARKQQIPVEVIPGPSAVLAALLASDLPCERFCFLGYPPSKGAARKRFLTEALALQRTVVLFESPHRIDRFLEEVVAIDPKRTLAICRELTKRFEETTRSTAAELLDEFQRSPRRGEFTVVIAPVGKGDDA